MGKQAGICTLTLVVVSCAASDSGLGLAITPLKAEYVAREPIALKMALSNKSQETLRFIIAYPIELGLEFVCSEEGTKRVASRFKAGLICGARPCQVLLRGEEYNSVVFLNDYLQFEQAKEYHVSCVGTYERHAGEKTSEKLRCQCNFSVKIKPGGTTPEHWRWLLQRWDGKEGQNAEEVVTGLYFVEDPAVIAHLVSFGREVPEVSWYAARAIARFAALPGGRAGLENLAEEFPGERHQAPCYDLSKNVLSCGPCWTGAERLENVLGAFSSIGKAPSEEFLRAQLSAKNFSRKFITLSFFLEPDFRLDIPMDAVRALCNDKNEGVAKLAKQVLEMYTPVEPENPGQF